MKKTFISLTLMCSLLGATPQLAYANENPNNTVNNTVHTLNETNNDISLRDAPNEYWTPWVIKSKTAGGNAYGSWSRVGEGRGSGSGGSLNISSNKSVSNTYSGTLKVSRGTLERSVGYSLNSSFTRTASYTIPTTNPKKTYWVDCRNIYKQTNVNQQSQYLVNGRVVKTDTKTVYAKQWTGFGYNWGTK